MKPEDIIIDQKAKLTEQKSYWQDPSFLIIVCGCCGHRGKHEDFMYREYEDIFVECPVCHQDAML